MLRTPTLILALTLAGCVADRPATWAQPVRAEGLAKLHRVSDTLYRCAQPDAEALARLDELGIATVINLQRYEDDRAAIEAMGLRYEQIPFDGWAPSDAQAAAFLRLVSDPAGGPYLVHCRHGADRTGAMTALYRVAVQGWTKDEAIREMRRGGYGYHWHMHHLVAWVRDMDVERLRREAGIE